MRTQFGRFASFGRTALAGLVAVLALTFAASGRAETRADRTLQVMVDKAQVVTLAGTASVVLIANPQIADVVVERDHLLFVIGKRPGETRLYVYGDNGRPLLEREVVVVPQDDRAVTVFRDTLTTTYSCDGRCVAINTQPGPAVPGAAAGLPPAAAPAPAPAPAASPAAPAAGLTASR